MDPLSREERERLFDYCLGLMCAGEVVLMEAWIARDEEAADFHTRLKGTLGPLESLSPERCPEDLAERTVQRLCAALREPPATELSETARHSLLREDLWLCLSSNILVR